MNFANSNTKLLSEETIDVELENGKIPDSILDKYLKNAMFGEDEVGQDEFVVKHKYIEVSIECINDRHRFLVNKLFGSIIGYATYTMTDINNKTLPLALKFYRETIRHIKQEISEDTNSTCANFRISSIIDRYIDSDIFIKNLKDFFMDDFNLESYEIYLNTMRNITAIKSQEERFIRI